ncbi:MAG TPA: Rne/Rng family ribonuclease [Verrucomicrobiae bacterium]|nr:Rne/Rng family ribonuclease [Verrucomicrobiae bacterium]
MNKELFVSSTPHETKVGLVEDDLLAEIYLERENEYTLAGSIYKGRVTRVLPGMQSAFVDIGLERDAFLYVSDFMELEEQDEDLTDAVPASRGVQDMRPQSARAEAAPAAETEAGAGAEIQLTADTEEGTVEADALAEPEPAAADSSAEPGNGDSSNRDRGGWRGRRRRRGRREGRERGPDRNADRSSERSPEPRFARSAENSRAAENNRASGPPPGYQPILLPGESISKYQRWAQAAAEPEAPSHSTATETAEPSKEAEALVASVFPEDEPIFAADQALAEPLHEEHEDIPHVAEEVVDSAATTVPWNQEFRREEEAGVPALGWPGEMTAAVEQAGPGVIEEEVEEEVSEEPAGRAIRAAETTEPSASREELTPAFAAPGTMEEETIEEDEADAIGYESSSDEGYDEFEEETQAVGAVHLNGDAREAVSEIHLSSLAEGEPHADAAASEEDSEEIELEEAQAEAEAMLDAEARGNGTVDARAEVRAPSATAGYTQRSPRPAWERRSQRGRRGNGRRFRRRESAAVPLISDLLKEGQEILVQIAKEPIGKKGARITSHIALPGRFLVYMPTVNHTGVSRKIASEEERQRLKRIISSERENGHGGFIVRTAAQNASEDELRADIRFLKGLWQDIKNRAENSKPPALIYHDLNVVERVLRDQVTSDFNVIWVDTEPEYERILRFFNRFQPAMVKRVKLYTKETPLFEQFGLQEEMNKALKSKVWLKSGGYIVINQTEALVAIDINTGKYVGKTQRLEDTIVKTNVDAIREIVRQVRLRDLGGIIIIDFIDMDERRNRQRVMQALEEELRKDRAPSKTLQFNDFGLVAITRKRVKQSLERTIGSPCPYCQATGYVKSVATVCNEIYVEMRKIAKHLEHEDVLLRVHPDVAKELKSNNARLLNEMEELTKRTIIVKSDPAVHQEQFDIN